MKNSEQIYISQLNFLREDLIMLMKDWPSGLSFDNVEIHAKTILPLIAAEIQYLQKSPINSLIPNPVKLVSELQELHNLITNDNDKRKFSEYIAMVDSLISSN